ncbi:aminoacetone oxidase family FAD-binding enzyme [uncultured Bilophila sp.]|uniref:NAD(P)/FAD-dependent oxidoreductase n=1 Tax=uncultured Bilophila sp. TaxID=529385 RepID=UPI0026DD550B|nr:aminoacetone oxidase family FAD-binding enzyme [uncultured Bilophila sp.]
MIRDAVILGAGAAGLMCAMTAGRRGFSCAVIDHSPVAGRKVRLAGGGKGNVTNRFLSSDWYVCSQTGFPDALLRRCSTDFILDMLTGFGIGWEEREYGQIFCTEQAARLVEALTDACRETGNEILLRRTLGDIRYEDGLFTVETSDGSVRAPRLVIATGSPAWPDCGATDAGMRLARLWGHKVIPVRPALVPLLFPESWPLHGLAGVSVPANVSAGGRSFRYPLLFTHKGMSGPGILQASCFWKSGEPLHIDFLPEQPALELMHAPENGKSTVLGLFKKHLPTRLAERLVPETLATRKVAQLAKKDREALALALHDHVVVPTRSEGMGHAEAAAGGVDTRDVNPRTLESRKRPGLYFAGEVLDVTGLLGGYNLHWAWASGKAVGESWKKDA